MVLKALHALPKGGLTKTLRIMKITAIILLSACLTASANGHSQKVTLSEKNARLEKVFNSIKQQTGYEFLYTDEMLQKAERITIDLRSVELQDALNVIFKNQPLTYSIIGKTVVVKPRTELIYEQLPSPPLPVRGRVVNENGEPVAASIMVKGTSNGTTTDDQGYFVLNNVNENATLVISGVSIETVELNIGSKADIQITVKTLVKPLEEVISKGYYREKKITNTGNVSKVTAATIVKQPVLNTLQAIQGRMPGIYIVQRTGVPGGSFTIQIRGQHSLRNTGAANGNLPLYVINGVPFTSANVLSNFAGNSIVNGGNPLGSINPSDIESIEVLKDGDATAIYGSRGTNGVVLITTKSGKSGKTRVDLNVWQGWGAIPKKMKLLNTAQYQEMRNEAFANDGATPQPWDHDVNGNWDKTRYTDWQEELIGGTSKITNAQAQVSGGNNETNFLIGGGYFKETTVFPGDFSYQRGSVNSNMNHISKNRKFEVSISSSYSAITNKLLNLDLTREAVLLAPNAPALYNADGSLNWANSTWTNPLAWLRRKYKGNTNTLVSNAIIGYHIAEGITAKTSIGYTNMQVKELNTLPIMSRVPPTTGLTGSSIFANNSVVTWIAEPQIEYSKDIKLAKMSLLVGGTFQQTTTDGNAMQASGYTSDALIENLQAATSVAVLQYNYSQYRYNAIRARLNFNRKERYIMNLIVNRDGSSRFGPDKQFANFYSIGGAWVFSKENFMVGIPFLSYGKLRASYALTGNDQIGDYGYLATYSPTSYPYNGIGGLIPTRLLNPDFSWEKTRKIEVGLETGFLKDRVLFNVSWYRHRSSNQLVGFSLPLITGQSSIQYNLPATVQNKGWEFDLTAQIVKLKKFTWTSNINLTIPRNKLLKYENIGGSPYANTYVVGEPLSIVKLFKYNGLNSQTGLYMFEDVNGNGVTDNPGDKQFFDNIGQRFFGGFQNTISFQQFELDFLFQFVRQDGYNYISFFNPPGTAFNNLAVVMDRWQKPGDNAPIQKFSQSFATGVPGNYFNYYQSTASISDASFIKLRNLSLTYEISKGLIEKLKVQSIKLYILGQNLITISDYQGFDPENNQSALFLPPLRVITGGIRVTL